jgi:gliding motility-associated-like protein
VVQPEILAFAGEDTAVVTGQPLQLHASGGSLYQWSPSFGLSETMIADPVARFTASTDEGYFIYKVLVADHTGCMDSATVKVKIFSTAPEIYVPSAFTPNSDGRNDFFQLVAAGIRRVQVFRVYNRWGQLVFDSPTTHSRGWDGSMGGKPQPSDTYVWIVQALDYTGVPLSRRGTVTLIR